VKRASSILIAIVSAAATFASYVGYAQDRDARSALYKWSNRFNLSLRHPDVVDSLEYAPSADFGADLLTDVTLRDVAAPVDLTKLEPAVRIAWLDAVPRFDEQMRATVNIELVAIGERPGWPYHSALLGQVVYARDARAVSGDLVRRYNRWCKPLYIAAANAQSDETLWQALAISYIQTWPDLRVVHELTSRSVFVHAFSDVTFVRAALRPAITIVGTSSVLA
jgi:hypothetical protein